MPLERFSAAWREQYVTSTGAIANTTDAVDCVFCLLADAEVDASTGVLWRNETTYVALNAFPYGSGHLLILPRRHVANLTDMTPGEYEDFFIAIRRVVLALSLIHI